jgi:hypothetical protein
MPLLDLLITTPESTREARTVDTRASASVRNHLLIGHLARDTQGRHGAYFCERVITHLPGIKVDAESAHLGMWGTIMFSCLQWPPNGTLALPHHNHTKNRMRGGYKALKQSGQHKERKQTNKQTKQKQENRST